MKPRSIVLGFSSLVFLLLLSLFQWDIFPDCFLEGVGLTPFKKISGYVISSILAGSVVLLLKNRKKFDAQVLRLLIVSILLTVAAELAFTFYINVYGFSNLVGHFLKLISFYLIYKAIIETGFVRPYKLLFRNLRQSEEMLQKANEDLETRVTERTAELLRTNKALLKEIGKRKEIEEELRRLSSELLTVQENERKRIARELHDGLGQILAAIKSKMEKTLRDRHEGKEDPRPELEREDVIPLIQRGIDEARRIQADLRPSILDDLGILAAIGWFCREFEKIYSGIRIERRIDLNENEVPDSLKTPIYRVLQEALNNVAKHSGANHVSLHLQKREERIELTIEDNGRGFNLGDRLPREGGGGGFGLTSMRERTELSGGSFSLESVKGKGTQIRTSWPGPGEP